MESLILGENFYPASVFEDPNGKIWIYTRKNESSEMNKIFVVDNSIVKIFSNNIIKKNTKDLGPWPKLFLIENDKIGLLTKKGIFVLDKSAKMLENSDSKKGNYYYVQNSNEIFYFLKDEKKCDIFKYNKEKGKLIFFKRIIDRNEQINGPIIKDKNNNFWFLGGVDMFMCINTDGYLKEYKFSSSLQKPKFNTKIDYLKNRGIMYASDLGITVLNIDESEQIYNLDLANNLSSNNIIDFIIDKNNLLWVSTSIGLDCFEISNKHNNYFEFKNNFPLNKSINQELEGNLFVDSYNNLYVPTLEYIYKIEKNKAVVNYGVFTSTVSIEALEYVQNK
jgi:hypothetical protein